MEPLLYLPHRVPYPPNKGDKIRTYHLLRYLSRHYRVYLGTFADLAEDRAHEGALRQWCAEVRLIPLSPLRARARCTAGLLRGEPLSLAYYRSAELQQWVDRVVAEHGIGKAVTFSSMMTMYFDRPGAPRLVADYCDVDSQKWAQYAEQRGWPASMIYGREARTLLAFERKMAARAAACTFVSSAEAELFVRLAPECADRVHAIGNGVDSEYFSPQPGRPSPYPAGELPIVFTGAMDYWPNVDAVAWFAREVMPILAAAQPQARFYIVGMNPAPTVSALAGARVVVTGRVADVRPYLQHARVVVAPLRVARGVQNKVFEAMSMARPVVVSAAVAQGIHGAPLLEFDIAADAAEFARKVEALLDPAAGDEMGRRARRRVLDDYDWDARLAGFGALLDAAPARRARANG
jgi:sugar transferase (PEP-CTERM/EpsH1 system associated)